MVGVAEHVVEDVAIKRERLRAWLAARALPGVVLTKPGPVAWLTGGLTGAVDRSDPYSPLWVVVTETDARALTNEVEEPRLRAESALAELGLELETVPWYEAAEALPRTAAEVAGVRARELASDGHPAFGCDADADLASLRLSLLPAERRRLRALGLDTARALEAALASWRPGVTDLAVQATAAERLERAGARPVCLLVGGDDRVERFRHPLAIGAPAQRLVMAVAVAERFGLHAAASRFASAGPLADHVAGAQAAALEVEARMLAATRVGATYGEVLLAAERAYADVGRPGAWTEHYQGGPIGYRQREFELAPCQRESRWYEQTIEVGHAVAWNPSVAGGGKVEDTFLVDEDGLECVTDTGAWPSVAGRPAVLDVESGGPARVREPGR